METPVKKQGLPKNLNEYRHIIDGGVTAEDTITWTVGLRRNHVSPKLNSPNGPPQFKKQDPAVRPITHTLCQSIIDQPRMRRASLQGILKTADQSQAGFFAGLRNSWNGSRAKKGWDYSPVKSTRHGKFLPQVRGLLAKKQQVFKNQTLQFESDFVSASKNQEEFDDHMSYKKTSHVRHLMGRNFRCDTNAWVTNLRSSTTTPKTSIPGRRTRSLATPT